MSDLYLVHHGIKGQKWGVRRYQNEDGSLTPAGQKRYSRVVGTKNGLSVVEKRKWNGEAYEFLNSDSKKVGEAFVEDQGDNIYLEWIGVRLKERGKGYAQSALDLLMDDAKKSGKKTMTLEAAGLDPSAIHVYTKKGFRILETMENEIWGGLTKMVKDL